MESSFVFNFCFISKLICNVINKLGSKLYIYMYVCMYVCIFIHRAENRWCRIAKCKSLWVNCESLWQRESQNCESLLADL